MPHNLRKILSHVSTFFILTKQIYLLQSAKISLTTDIFFSHFSSTLKFVLFLGHFYLSVTYYKTMFT